MPADTTVHSTVTLLFLVIPVGLAVHTPTDGRRPCYVPTWRRDATSLSIASRGTVSTPPGAEGLEERPDVAFFLRGLPFSHFALCLLLLAFEGPRERAE